MKLCSGLVCLMPMAMNVKLDHIVVTGQALNARGGAVVIFKDDRTCYLDGMNLLDE